MDYRRVFIQNTCVHLILTTYNRKSILINHIEILRNAFKNTLNNYTFKIVAICVLPEHIHLIINPKKIEEYPKIISSIKHYFSKNVGQVCSTDNLKSGYKNKREKGIFQRRYFEHTIISENDLENQINYVHYNPVKHGIVQNVKDWEFSSFHKFVKEGLYEENWGSSMDIVNIKDFNFE